MNDDSAALHARKLKRECAQFDEKLLLCAQKIIKLAREHKWEMWEITLRALRSFLSVPFPKNGRNLQKFPNLRLRVKNGTTLR